MNEVISLLGCSAAPDFREHVGQVVPRPLVHYRRRGRFPASADEAPNRIRIEYELPKSKNYEDLAQRLKANHALEKMQEILNFAFKSLIRPHMDQELEKTVLQEGWLPDVLAEPDVPPPPPTKE